MKTTNNHKNCRGGVCPPQSPPQSPPLRRGNGWAIAHAALWPRKWAGKPRPYAAESGGQSPMPHHGRENGRVITLTGFQTLLGFILWGLKPHRGEPFVIRRLKPTAIWLKPAAIQQFNS